MHHGDYWERRSSDNVGRRRLVDGEPLVFAASGSDGKFKGFIKAKDLKEAKEVIKKYGTKYRICSKVGFRG
jgi:hypothetical protein